MEPDAPVIGLLCSRNDPFGMVRSDMMVGPMLLAGLFPVRFFGTDIHPQGRYVNGCEYRSGAWAPCKDVALHAVLDCSLPRTIRSPEELSLLERVPHSVRIDLDRYELLELLSRDEQFSAFIPPCRPFADAPDLRAAVEDFESVIVKSRSGQSDNGPLFIRGENPGWTVADRYGMRRIDRVALSRATESLAGTHFIQAFRRAPTPQGRPYALLCTTQQLGNLTWSKPTIHGVVGNHPVFASLTSCGEYIGAPFVPNVPIDVLGARSLPPGFGVRLSGLIVAVARRLSEHACGHPGSLGLTIIIDSDFKLSIVNVDSRPPAPRRPARNLEFHRHCAEFVGTLAMPAPTVVSLLPVRKAAQATLPEQGISIRSAISEADVEALAAKPPSWIDVPLVHGSRCVLRELSSKPADSLGEVFLTLRLGNAINDLGCEIHGHERISSIEDYLGRGLLRWKEYLVMRSIRKVFLATQFDLANRVLEGLPPSMLIVEDFDLGAQALPDNELQAEMSATVAWLDRMAKDGFCQSWGVGFSSAWTANTQALLDRCVELGGQRGNLKLVYLRNKLPDRALSERLHQLGIRVAVAVAHANAACAVRQSRPELCVLSPWVPVHHER